MWRAAVVERRNERLNDRHRAVVRAHIAPRLQVMRLRHMPMREHGRLVVVITEMRPEWHFLERIDEIEICRRIEHRIAAEDDECFDGTAVHIGDELAQRFELIHRRDFHRIGDRDRRADVAEKLIDGHGDRMNDGRLIVARDHDARPAIRQKILCDRCENSRGRLSSTQRCENSAREPFNF